MFEWLERMIAEYRERKAAGPGDESDFEAAMKDDPLTLAPNRRIAAKATGANNWEVRADPNFYVSIWRQPASAAGPETYYARAYLGPRRKIDGPKFGWDSLGAAADWANEKLGRL